MLYSICIDSIKLSNFNYCRRKCVVYLKFDIYMNGKDWYMNY